MKIFSSLNFYLYLEAKVKTLKRKKEQQQQPKNTP